MERMGDKVRYNPYYIDTDLAVTMAFLAKAMSRLGGHYEHS